MKESTLKKLNTIIFLHNFVYPLWMIFCFNTLGISFYFFLGVIVFMIATGVVYKKVYRIKNGRKILHYLRVALFLCIAGLFVPSIVLFSFNDTKSMYNVKRLNYVYGVYGVSGERVELSKKLLPEKLPDECEDYSYMTEGWLHFHSAPSCLTFRTDEETIEYYAEYYSLLCDEIRVENHDSEEKIKGLDSFLKQARISDESRRGEFDNAELYWIDGHFPKGALLDRDSGYVVILT